MQSRFVQPRIQTAELDAIAGYRYGFMIADMVLGDTLAEFAEGETNEDDLEVALLQHRQAYEGYVRRLQASMTAIPRA